MPYVIVDDLTQSVIDGPYHSRAEAEQALIRIGLGSAYIAESPAQKPQAAPGTEVEVLRLRWRNIAGGHWVAAYNAMKRRDYATMRREAEAARAAKANADPLIGAVFGNAPSVPRGLERYEEAGARYAREIPRLISEVTAEMRRHEAWRMEMRFWEREARRTGGDPRQLFREFHAISDSLPAPGTKLALELRRCPRGSSQDHEGTIGKARVRVHVPFEQRLEPGQRRTALVEMTDRRAPETGHHRIAWFIEWADSADRQ
jgi:hypothetical protein